jgi:hypothetical protein
MRLGIDAAKKAGGVCEAVVCYSGDVANPKETKYTLKYYLDFIDQLVEEGIHVLGVKDMAGLLKPEAARMYDHICLSSMWPSLKMFLLASSVQFERDTQICPFTSILMTPLVLPLPVCLQQQQLEQMWWTWPSIVRFCCTW